MSDIFLSYKHAQRQEARQLSSALAGRGWTVWWDGNIPAGANWQAELDAQLDAAGCVVVLWSGDSVQSEWVLYEARSGLRSGKLVQALLEPVQPPPEFAALQAVDLAGWGYELPFHAGFDHLRAAIRDLLDRRAPLATSRSGTWVRTSTDAGDVLSRGSSASVVSRARPAPVMLLPPPFPDLVDRGGERADIMATLAERRGVSLAGESGSGKSALLCHVGNLDHTARFHDGVVYLQAATQGESDLAQAVHEAFFDVAPGNRPSAVEVRRNLADKTALLILDDVALPAAGLDALCAHAPGSAWVLASEQIAASARRRPVALKGLPVDDGILLFERALWRTLAPDERAIVARIVESVHGHPARIEQAAGAAAVHGVAAALNAIADAPKLDDQDSRSRRVLAALACGGDVALEPEQCAAIAEVDGIDDVLAGLMRRGLVQYVPPGFRLAAGLAPGVEATSEFAACRQRATRAFMLFAFEARGTPRRVARLAAPMTAQMAWAAEHDRSAEALQLARALDGPLAEANRWDAWRDMLSRAHDIAARAGDDATAGWALHQLGHARADAGRQARGAAPPRRRPQDAQAQRRHRGPARHRQQPQAPPLVALGDPAGGARRRGRHHARRHAGPELHSATRRHRRSRQSRLRRAGRACGGGPEADPDRQRRARNARSDRRDAGRTECPVVHRRLLLRRRQGASGTRVPIPRRVQAGGRRSACRDGRDQGAGCRRSASGSGTRRRHGGASRQARRRIRRLR